jgi:hypothetical protein
VMPFSEIVGGSPNTCRLSGAGTLSPLRSRCSLSSWSQSHCGEPVHFEATRRTPRRRYAGLHSAGRLHQDQSGTTSERSSKPAYPFDDSSL